MMSSIKSSEDQRTPHEDELKKFDQGTTSDDQEDNAYTSWLNKDFDLVETHEDVQSLHETIEDEIEVIHLSGVEQSLLFKPHTTSTPMKNSKLKAMHENSKTNVTLKSHQETTPAILENDLVDMKTELKKNYYLPSFLTFFILLITITIILLTYSTTYL